MSIMFPENTPTTIASSRENILQPELINRLAENVPVDFLYETMRKLIQKRGANGLYCSAWAHIEYALGSTSLFIQDRNQFLSDAAWLLWRTADSKTTASTNTVRLQATVLSAFIPLFRQRLTDKVPTKTDTDMLYKSLVASLELAYDNDPTAKIGSLRPDTKCNEVLVEAAAARGGIVLFPASPREEATDLQDHNHDSYFCIDGAKYPIQIKDKETDKFYQPHISIIVMRDLLNGHSATEALQAMQNDAKGYVLRQKEVHLLNHMTSVMRKLHRQKLSVSQSQLAA